MALVPFVGYTCDKIKPWLVLAACNFLVLVFSILILVDMNSLQEQDLGILFDVGFVGQQSLGSITFMVCMTYLSKVCNPITRGTIFNLNGFIGSTFLMPF